MKKLLYLLALVLLTGCAAASPDAGNAVLDTLAKSISYNAENGTLSFAIPEKLPDGARLALHVSGRLKMGESGMSWHAFEEESENFTWVAGKTYTTALVPGSVDYLLLSMGLEIGGKTGREITAEVNSAGEIALIVSEGK